MPVWVVTATMPVCSKVRACQLILYPKEYPTENVAITTSDNVISNRRTIAGMRGGRYTPRKVTGSVSDLVLLCFIDVFYTKAAKPAIVIGYIIFFPWPNTELQARPLCTAN